jgi:signal transduction histidine kinase
MSRSVLPPPIPHDLASDRLAELQRFTAAVSSAVSMRDVAEVLLEDGLERLGARAVGIVWLMRPGELELVFGRGVSEREFKLLDAAARHGERLPIRDAIRERRSVWLESPEEIRERYPVLEPLRALRGESGFAIVPLVVGERCPGVIGFTFDRTAPFSPAERSFVETLARVSAQAFERARLFEAEREARREAERVGQLQHQLMAVVGHDLRTPLTAIRISCELLQGKEPLSPAQARSARRISSSVSRMAGIIHDLLDFGRVREGLGLAIDVRPLDLAEVASRAVHEFEESERGRVAIEVGAEPSVEADEGRLLQVVSNLVGNALQHGARGDVRVRIGGDARSISLSVHNGGAAIAPELLPHVFEPFRQGDGRGGRAAGGSSGLGLFIVREIVAAHGGSVAVTSDAASGTTFEVRLPRAAPR